MKFKLSGVLEVYFCAAKVSREPTEEIIRIVYTE